MARIAAVVRKYAEELGRVAAQGAAAQVERPKPQKYPAKRNAHHRVERVLQVHLAGGRAGVRQVAAEDDPRQRRRERLPVAAVAPVGDQEPLRAVVTPGLLGGGHVLAHVLNASGE